MDNLLKGGTLYICQSGEIIPDNSEACQNLKNKRDDFNWWMIR